MLETAVANCTDCALHRSRKRAVPGEGPTPARVMLIGEAPGPREEEDTSRKGGIGKPFVGMAGQFMERMLLPLGLSRDEVYISNVLKCRPPNNRDPSTTEMQACTPWLDIEMQAVNPAIIMCLGKFSIRYVTKTEDTVDHLHGRPIKKNGTIVLPAYHPAAGLHKGGENKLGLIYEDFQALGELLRGKAPEDFGAKDEYPSPTYREVASAAEARELLREPRYALDTETADGAAWSVQVSLRPGEAYFIPRETCIVIGTPPHSQVAVHNYLYDARFLDIPNFLDTMVMAYLLGLPQSLKTLANRLCGMEMMEYNEVVGPYGKDRVVQYLEGAISRDWAKPAPVEEVKWNNKAGRIIAKTRQPEPVEKTAKRILADMVDKPDTDPYDRWRKMDESKRTMIEEELGPIPVADLRDIPDRQVAVDYACRDADATIRVLGKIETMIKERELDFVLKAMDLPLLPMLLRMMEKGMAVDLDKLRELSQYYLGKMEIAADEAAKIVGRRFNPGSGPQVAKVVYSDMGFKPTKMTPTGGISTDDGELMKIKHPIIDRILEYRGLAKNKDAYADTLGPRAIEDDGGTARVHTTIKPTRVASGRLAVENPQLQAIPIRLEEGRKIRSAFIAPEGRLLVGGDLEQIEVKVLAHESQDPVLLDILRSGRDVHTETSMAIFHLPEEIAATTNYRYPAKRTTFGVIFLITEVGLYNDLIEHGADGWSVRDCKEMIDGWNAEHRPVRDYQMEIIAFARRYGYAVDMFGRRRYIYELACPIKRIQGDGERAAASLPIQAGAQGIIKLAMAQMERESREWKWADPLIQVHDEMIYEVDEDKAEWLAGWMKGTLENAVSLSVPVTASVKIGKNWNEMA